MAKRAKGIEDLLAEREQFATWLTRLDESADVASDKVRDKVRDDYQKRLETVMEELGSHGDSIAEQLADHRGTQEDLTARETSAREELAEAEVRHTVGEYDDDEWKKLKDMADEQLEQIGKDLEEVTVEIERLASVQALIASRPSADDEEAGADDTMADVEDSVISISTGEDDQDDDAALGAPQFTPRGATAAGESNAPRTLRFPGGDAKESSLDELDFLKSVTEDESAGPSASSATGGTADSVEPESAPEVATSSADADSSGQPQTKTLKCGECGELNRPTEWYCERCGAELASL